MFALALSPWITAMQNIPIYSLLLLYNLYPTLRFSWKSESQRWHLLFIPKFSHKWYPIFWSRSRFPLWQTRQCSVSWGDGLHPCREPAEEQRGPLCLQKGLEKDLSSWRKKLLEISAGTFSPHVKHQAWIPSHKSFHQRKGIRPEELG